MDYESTALDQLSYRPGRIENCYRTPFAVSIDPWTPRDLRRGFLDAECNLIFLSCESSISKFDPYEFDRRISAPLSIKVVPSNRSDGIFGRGVPTRFAELHPAFQNAATFPQSFFQFAFFDHALRQYSQFVIRYSARLFGFGL